MTIRDFKRAANARLTPVSDYASHDVELFLCKVLECNLAWLLGHHEIELSTKQLVLLDHFVHRRLAQEPIQYILGEQEFYGLRFAVSPAVLIPRPETEHLVEAVLERLPQGQVARVVDVGTGSGAIAVALAHARGKLQVTALDLSPEALQIAHENAVALGVEERVRFVESDLLAAVEAEQFDCVVSNPPYVAAGEILEPQVLDWEPHLALFAGADGLDVYRRLIVQAAAVLVPGGLLAMEAGAGQQAALNQLLGDDGVWSSPEWVADLQGIARVVFVTRVAGA